MAPSRRTFLQSLAAGASVFAAPYERAAAAVRNKIKITDVKCMIVRGTAHAASSMREFRIHELAKYIDWWQDLVLHEGPIVKDGYLTIQDKPGYGVEINPDVAKAHLAPGETWWG